jgi:hypothetical protein
MACEPNRFSWQLFWWAGASAALSIAGAVLRSAGLIPPSLRWVVALIPVLPMLGFFFGMARYLRSIDEMQRLMHLEALFFQFGATAVLVMAYGALAKAQAVPSLSPADIASGVWIASFVLWGIGLLVVRRKYQ